MPDDPSVPWFQEAFRHAYLSVYAHRDDASAQAEIAFVAAALGVRSGEVVLDAGCGAGRHGAALAAYGVRVVGLDLSEDLLRAAARRTRPPLLVRGDLRSLPLRAGSARHVVSLFTSFGYFDDAGNRAQLAEFGRVLQSGGRLLLDFLNAERVRATLVPRSERIHRGEQIVEERAIRGGRVEKDVTVSALRDSGASMSDEPVLRQWRESVQLYDRAELEGLVRAAGLVVTSTSGGLDGSEWTARSLRTVVVAVKP